MSKERCLSFIHITKQIFFKAESIMIILNSLLGAPHLINYTLYISSYSIQPLKIFAKYFCNNGKKVL